MYHFTKRLQDQAAHHWEETPATCPRTGDYLCSGLPGLRPPWAHTESDEFQDNVWPLDTPGIGNLDGTATNNAI